MELNTHSTLKQVSIPSFQESFLPKMKYVLNAIKCGNQGRLSSLIINMIFEIADLDAKLKSGQIWSQNCNVPDCYQTWHSEKVKHARIINILIGNDDLDPILQICEIWS